MPTKAIARRSETSRSNVTVHGSWCGPRCFRGSHLYSIDGCFSPRESGSRVSSEMLVRTSSRMTANSYLSKGVSRPIHASGGAASIGFNFAMPV